MNKDPRHDARAIVKAAKYLERMVDRLPQLIEKLPPQSRKEVNKRLKSLTEKLLARYHHVIQDACSHNFVKIEDTPSVQGNGYSVCTHCGKLKPPDAS
jgi:hypothetical protein